MRGGQSAIRHPLRSIGLVSTVGSLSGTPPLGTKKRSCNALPKPAARDSLCPSPWAIVLWEASDQRGRLLVAAFGFAGCSMPSYDRALWALRTWLDSWAGIGHVAVGMHRQGYDLQLTQYDDKGWRGAYYTTWMKHRPSGAIAPGWARPPGRPPQRAAWEALDR